MWDRACVDAASVPAPAGGEHTGRNPTDRGKLGTNHHLLVDERWRPLSSLDIRRAGTRHAFPHPVAEPTLAVNGWQAMPAGVQVSCVPAERTLQNPSGLRCLVVASPLASHARRRFARKVWMVTLVVERTFGWLHCFRRLRIRHEP
jgi:hypothetical protein